MNVQDSHPRDEVPSTEVDSEIVHRQEKALFAHDEADNSDKPARATTLKAVLIILAVLLAISGITYYSVPSNTDENQALQGISAPNAQVATGGIEPAKTSVQTGGQAQSEPAKNPEPTGEQAQAFEGPQSQLAAELRTQARNWGIFVPVVVGIFMLISFAVCVWVYLDHQRAMREVAEAEARAAEAERIRLENELEAQKEAEQAAGRSTLQWAFDFLKRQWKFVAVLFVANALGCLLDIREFASKNCSPRYIFTSTLVNLITLQHLAIEVCKLVSYIVTFPLPLIFGGNRFISILRRLILIILNLPNLPIQISYYFAGIQKDTLVAFYKFWKPQSWCRWTDY